MPTHPDNIPRNYDLRDPALAPAAEIHPIFDAIFSRGGFANSVPMAVVALDPDLRVVGCNNVACAMFGWKADQIIGSRIGATQWRRSRWKSWTGYAAGS